jgi:very-short-patch-repair endonuclease
MTQIFNRSEETEKRRNLRRNLAPAEALLWTHLQGRKLLGYKFRRQYGVDRYVVDFYCPALRLAIDVDGDSHCGAEAVGETRIDRRGSKGWASALYGS